MTHVNRIADDLLDIDVVGGGAEAGRPAFHPFLYLLIPTVNIYSISTVVLSRKKRNFL